MTIGIAIAVPDGITLAADTQTFWSEEIRQVKVKGIEEPVELERPIRQPAGWSPGAKKLFPFEYGKHKAAILAAGMSSIGKRTARAVFKKLEMDCPATDSCQEVIDFLVARIKAELMDVYQVKELWKAPISVLEFVFTSFENKDITKPFISSNVVFSGTLSVNGVADTSGHFKRWQNPTGQYGACWIGRTEFVAHLVNHTNPALPRISGQYHLMTLADAVSYAKFLAEFTCDFQDFAVMVPDCGRPVVTAIVTPDEFRYVDNAPAF
ncbi:MAG: hypothetical protein ACOYZ7_15995 [Chloroflexota bacterium]